MTNLDLLEAMNGIGEDTVLHTRRLLEHEEKQSMNKSKKIWRTVLIAAVIIGALLAGLFTHFFIPDKYINR